MFIRKNIDNSVPVELFVVLKSKNQIYHKVIICCDDIQGIYKCGQWYTSISLQSWNVSQESYDVENYELKQLINIVAITLHKKENMSPPLYSFITETWLCRLCNGHMCLPIISQQLITTITKS